MATPQDMAQTMIDNLPAKTGKAMDAWLALLTTSGLDKHGQLVKWLKTEHGMTHGFANLVAHTYRNGLQDAAEPDDLVAAQYAGAKADLRPIYDALVAQIQGFGADVQLAPKKAYVSLRRSKQFGLIQPSIKTRVDVGLNLKGAEPSERLEASGSFNAMVSHRVRLSSPDDVDAQLIGWLQQAYEGA